FSVYARRVGVDKWQQPTRLVAFYYIRIYAINKVVVERVAGYLTRKRYVILVQLNAVKRFTILFIRLAADRIAYAGGSHEVTFIRGVDKHLTLENQTALHHDLRDGIAFFADTAFAIETLLVNDINFFLAEHVVVHP